MERCHHIGIFVYDLKKMSSFYARRLGFNFGWEYEVDAKAAREIFGFNFAGRIQYLFLDGLGIELFYFPNFKLKCHNIKTSGYNHWTLVVKDKTSFCENLKTHKVKVIKIAKPNGFTYFIKDPESNIIEIKETRDVRKKRY